MKKLCINCAKVSAEIASIVRRRGPGLPLFSTPLHSTPLGSTPVLCDISYFIFMRCTQRRAALSQLELQVGQVIKASLALPLRLPLAGTCSSPHWLLPLAVAPFSWCCSCSSSGLRHAPYRCWHFLAFYLVIFSATFKWPGTKIMQKFFPSHPVSQPALLPAPWLARNSLFNCCRSFHTNYGPGTGHKKRTLRSSFLRS